MNIIKQSADKIFFAGDLHLWHHNVIEFGNRPCKDINEMHELLIHNWNLKIPKDGKVYILGDVSWKGLEMSKPILDRLNGEKILIIGNHDSNSVISYFDKSYEMLGLRVAFKGTEIICHLCHYPMFEWYQSQKGSINIHAHCHGNNDQFDKNNCNRIDVGLDTNNLLPYSFEEIINKLQKRKLHE